MLPAVSAGLVGTSFFGVIRRSKVKLCLLSCECLALEGISARLHGLLGRPRRGGRIWLSRRAGGLE